MLLWHMPLISALLRHRQTDLWSLTLAWSTDQVQGQRTRLCRKKLSWTTKQKNKQKSKRTTRSGSRHMSDFSAVLLKLFSSHWFTFSALIWVFLPCFIASCYVVFDCCLWENNSFLKGKRRKVNLESRGGGGCWE